MRPFNPQAQVQAKSSAKITTDYSYTIKGDPSAPIGQFGGASREDVNFSFKAGQIVEGSLDNLGKNILVQVGNYVVNIPRSNWELQSLNGVKISNTVSKEEGIYTSPEEKFWKGLGFTQSDMIKPQDKGRFFLAVALVAGYFAYKKFKK